MSRRSRPALPPSDPRLHPERRAQARAAITRWNAKRHLLPKCGARRKHDGAPCEHLAMLNGRCAFHGGATPRGKDWHRPRWPNGALPDAERRLKRKLADLDRAARKRARRLEAMTPEERIAHENWQRAHTPGDPKRRAADRERRRQARDAAKLFAADPVTVPISAEAKQIEEHLATLRADLERRQRPTNADDEHDKDNPLKIGVFS